MARLVVKAPVLSECGDVVRISADICFPDKTETLWFDVPQAFRSMLSGETCDAFLVASLMYAMQKGLDIVVQGPLSTTLFYNIERHEIDLLVKAFPHAQRIHVFPEKLIETNWGGRGVLTGFSGGVDSLCTYIDHKDNVPESYKITHFLFNNVGAHEEGEDPQARIDNRKAVFHKHAARIKESVKDWGIPVIVVDSNLADVFDVSFLETHSLRNAAVALLFQKGAKNFIYSAGLSYADSTVNDHHDIAYIDAFGMRILSTETMTSFSYGHQYSRIDKTRIVAEDPVSYHTLDVCMCHEEGENNCSRCPKCLRTALTLEILGQLDRFSSVFNLERYRAFRSIFLCYVFISHDSLLKEIKAQIKSQKIPVPLWICVATTIVPRRVINFVFFRCMDNKCTQAHKLVWFMGKRIVDKYISNRC